MDTYDPYQYIQQILQQQRNVEAAAMGGGGLGPQYYGPGAIFGAAQMQNAYSVPYKPKPKTQAMKRYEKLLKKRDVARLHKRLFLALLLITAPISWYFFEDGLLIECGIIGVIVAVWALAQWLNRNE